MTLTPPEPNPLGPDPLDGKPLTGDDLAVDAVADGTATPAQQARVDASTSLQERVAVLVAIRAALAGPIAPLSAIALEDMIGVALAPPGLDRPLGERAGDDPQVVPASRHRPDRTRWLVAAALLLLLALGAVTLPRLTSGRTSSSDTASSAAAVPSTTEPASTGSDDAAAELAPPAGPAARDPDVEDLFAGSPLLSLGEVASVADLVERALTTLDGSAERAAEPSPDTGTASNTVARACLATLAPAVDLDPVELVATGRIDAVDHLVIVRTLPGDSRPTRSVEVVRIPDCVVIARTAR